MHYHIHIILGFILKSLQKIRRVSFIINLLLVTLPVIYIYIYIYIYRIFIIKFTIVIMKFYNESTREYS